MKHLAALAAVFLLFLSSAHAVTWINVSVSIIVNHSGPTLTKTTLTARKYIEEGSRRQGDPDLKNFFIGFRADTGQVAVVHIPTETVAYNVVSGMNINGSTSNGINTMGTFAGNATISSLNTDLAGYYHDKFTRKTDGSLKSVVRTVMAGSGNQTLTGTIRTTAKRFEL